MLVKTFSSAVQGVDAQTITVEVNAGGNVAAGQPFYHMVGLPDKAVKEGFQRIDASIKNDSGVITFLYMNQFRGGRSDMTKRFFGKLCY